MANTEIELENQEQQQLVGAQEDLAGNYNAEIASSSDDEPCGSETYAEVEQEELANKYWSGNGNGGSASDGGPGGSPTAGGTELSTTTYIGCLTNAEIEQGELANKYWTGNYSGGSAPGGSLTAGGTELSPTTYSGYETNAEIEQEELANKYWSGNGNGETASDDGPGGSLTNAEILHDELVIEYWLSNYNPGTALGYGPGGSLPTDERSETDLSMTTYSDSDTNEDILNDDLVNDFWRSNYNSGTALDYGPGGSLTTDERSETNLSTTTYSDCGTNSEIVQDELVNEYWLGNCNTGTASDTFNKPTKYDFAVDIGVVNNVFSHWHICERTVVMYGLLKRMPRANRKFLQACIKSSIEQIIETRSLDPKEVILLMNANDVEFLDYFVELYGKVAVHTKVELLAELLEMLPLLKPGNVNALKCCMDLVSLIMRDAELQNVPLEHVRRMVSYLIIHPALEYTERSTLLSYVLRLDIVEIEQKNRVMAKEFLPDNRNAETAPDDELSGSMTASARSETKLSPTASASNEQAKRVFVDDISAVDNVFSHLNTYECTFILYSLLKRIPYANLMFLQACIESFDARHFKAHFVYLKAAKLERNANNVEFLKAFVNRYAEAAATVKDELLAEILEMLPLLNPGNKDAMKYFIDLVPLTVRDAELENVSLTHVHQMLSYLFMHPALKTADRLPLLSYMPLLERCHAAQQHALLHSWKIIARPIRKQQFQKLQTAAVGAPFSDNVWKYNANEGL